MSCTNPRLPVFLALILFALDGAPPIQSAETAPPAETKIAGPVGTSIIVRMQGPYDAAVPLQVVCYFKRTTDSDQRLTGAPVELNKRLGGLIASLRARGEFAGDELETFLIDCPPGTIAAKQLLLIGLGDESTLSLTRMENVGRVAVREAARLGAKHVAFAPLIKDAGNDSLEAGAVETAVIRGMLLAYDTDRRLQQEQLSRPYQLETWIVEAGPKYYNATIAGVKTAIAEADKTISARTNTAYSNFGK